MRFTLTIDVDSDAFYMPDGTHDPAPELSRLLRRVSDQVYEGLLAVDGDGEPIRDYNGNTVGRWELGKDNA